MRIYFKVKNGKIFPTQNSGVYLKNLLNSYNNTDKLLYMEIQEHSPFVTEKQMSLYKALILHTCEKSGYSYSEMENELLDKCSSRVHEKDILGQITSRPQRIEEMDNNQFNVFLENAVQFVNEFFEAEFQLE